MARLPSPLRGWLTRAVGHNPGSYQASNGPRELSPLLVMARLPSPLRGWLTRAAGHNPGSYQASNLHPIVTVVVVVLAVGDAVGIPTIRYE